jgi:hypothetical protein
MQFLSGAIMMGFAVASMFFTRFWVKTKDRLFLAFAIAFSLMAVERIFLMLTDVEDETRTYLYFLRLIAFICIIVAIVDKNRKH